MIHDFLVRKISNHKSEIINYSRSDGSSAMLMTLS